jgi:hypothetical protein
LLLLTIAVGSDPYFHPTDLSAWLTDPEHLASCWRDDHWLGCEGLSKFPIAYLINAQILAGWQKLGYRPDIGLQFTNTLVVSLPTLVLIYFAQSWRKGLQDAGLYLLLLILSPLPAFYLRSAALEIQCGALLGIAILLGLINCQQQNRSLLFLANAFILLACLYKDTIAATFVITIGIALMLAPAPKPSVASLVWCWAPGLLGGIGFSLAWNIVRYNSILPVAYQTEASLNRPSFSQALVSLWALLFSPNGGFVSFWGAACAVLLLLFVFRERVQIRTLVFPLVLITMLVLVGVSTMALWWAPFGWDAWGARLSIPFVLASTITSLGMTSLAARDEPRRAAIGTVYVLSLFLAAVLVSCSLPYVLLGYTKDRSISYAKSMGGGCPGMFEEIASMRDGHPNILVRMWRSESYWPCIERRMWINPVVQSSKP